MYSDWDLDSELTELTSSEDEDPPKPSRKAPATKKPAKNEYKIDNVMRPPRTTSYSADWIYGQIRDELVDLNPSYQRDIVWPDSKQIGLVDSLLRNYYIPPVIFAVRRTPDGHEKRICIDGKQRLTSIRRFVDGEIYHKDGNKRYWFKQSTRKQLLPIQYQHAFRSKQIVCVEYEDLTNDQEREIFQRVQLGVPLTPAERMQSICGPWPDLVREIQETVLGDDGFGDGFEWDRARGREFQCLATVLFLIDSRATPSKTMAFPGTPQLERMLQQRNSVPVHVRDGVLQTFKILQVLAKDSQCSVCFQKPARVSPLEFIMTGILIWTRRKTLSLMQLSSAIALMREDVRAKHVDVRQNNKVSKTMWSFMKKINISKLQSDRKGDVPASETAKKPCLTKAVKRKRTAVESDEERPREVVRRPKRLDTQTAKRSNTKTTPTRQSSSNSTLTAKKPPIPHIMHSSKPSSSHPNPKDIGTAGTKETSASAASSSRHGHLSSPFVQATCKSSGCQSMSDSMQTVSPLSVPLTVTPSSSLSLSSTLQKCSGHDRLAPIRKAKCARGMVTQSANAETTKHVTDQSDSAQTQQHLLSKYSPSGSRQPSVLPAATSASGYSARTGSALPASGAHAVKKGSVNSGNNQAREHEVSNKNDSTFTSAAGDPSVCLTAENVTMNGSIGVPTDPRRTSISSTQLDGGSHDGRGPLNPATVSSGSHHTPSLPQPQYHSVPVQSATSTFVSSLPEGQEDLKGPRSGPTKIEDRVVKAKQQLTLPPTLPPKPLPAMDYKDRLSMTTHAAPSSPHASMSGPQTRSRSRKSSPEREDEPRRVYDSWRPDSDRYDEGGQEGRYRGGSHYRPRRH